MTLQTLIRKIKEADPLHTAEVWVKVGNANYLASNVTVDDEGDILIKVHPTPY